MADEPTDDLLMELLRTAPGWERYRQRITELQQQALQALLAAQPDDPPARVHKLIGEVNAYGRVLYADTHIAEEALRAREAEQARKNATRQTPARRR